MAEFGIHIALLRGINVGGANRVPMAELRAVCADLGWREVRTYIQSGNVVFRSDQEPRALETALEQGIVRRFRLEIPVIVRTFRRWKRYAEENPFTEQSEGEAKVVALCLSKDPPLTGAAEVLRERARASEIIRVVGDGMWIYYPSGMGRSKLTPALLDRAAGSPVTARNWRTVQRIVELASDTPPA